jgi:opacity protein-like surface antigen
MSAKVAVVLAVLFASISSLAQVQPAGSKGTGRVVHVNFSTGAGMDYWSGDGWGVRRWGPAAWATATVWHCLGINAEGHSMIVGGNREAPNYKLFVGEGGLMCTMGYWGRFQPIYKGELGFASLSQPGNGTGHLHSTYSTWAVGGGVEYHTGGHWWTRVDYTYEAIQNFHSSITNQNHTLNPRGISFGETYRFGASGTTF